MKYLQKSENFFKIPREYMQGFNNSMIANINRAEVMNQILKGGNLEDSIAVADFIYTVKFATEDQLIRFCQIKGIEEPVALINYLCVSAVLNKFGMVDEKNYIGPLPEDAMRYYCLNEGGRFLVAQYKDYENVEWEQADNFMAALKIEKLIIATELHLGILASKANILSLRKHPTFNVKQYSVSGQCSYTFDINGNMQHVITDVFRSFQSEDGITEKLRNYESLLTTNIWKKYYIYTSATPLLLIEADDLNVALIIAQTMCRITKLRDVIFTTDEKLAKGLNSPNSFYKYDETSGTLQEINFALFNA